MPATGQKCRSPSSLRSAAHLQACAISFRDTSPHHHSLARYFGFVDFAIEASPFILHTDYYFSARLKMMMIAVRFFLMPARFSLPREAYFSAPTAGPSCGEARSPHFMARAAPSLASIAQLYSSRHRISALRLSHGRWSRRSGFYSRVIGPPGRPPPFLMIPQRRLLVCRITHFRFGMNELKAGLYFYFSDVYRVPPSSHCTRHAGAQATALITPSR